MAESPDIVARIREKCFIGLIPEEQIEECLEAADEIENLRCRISKMKKIFTDLFNETHNV